MVIPKKPSIKDHVRFPLYYDTSASLYLPPRSRKLHGKTTNVGYETTRRIDQEEFVVLIIAMYYALHIGRNKHKMDELVWQYNFERDYNTTIPYLHRKTQNRTSNYWVYNLKNCSTEIDKLKIYKEWVPIIPGHYETAYITEIKIANCKTKICAINRVSVNTDQSFHVTFGFNKQWNIRRLNCDMCPCRLRINGCNGCAGGFNNNENFAVTWPEEERDDPYVEVWDSVLRIEEEEKHYKKPKISHRTINNLYEDNLLDPDLAGMIVTTTGGIKTRHKFHAKP